MGKLLRLKDLLSIAVGLFALQTVVARAHSVQHLAWTRLVTEVSQADTATADTFDACAICAAGASLSASLASSASVLLAPDSAGYLASGLAGAYVPDSHFRPGTRAPPAFLS